MNRFERVLINIVITITMVTVVVLCHAILASSEHSKETKEFYKETGLPGWCCSWEDCKEAEVVLLEYIPKWPRIRAKGEGFDGYYRVTADWKDGRRGIFVAPAKKTYVCFSKFSGSVICASVKPRVDF